MIDRGEYRGIRVCLIDGPDYQALSPEAKLVLLTLKLKCGQSGICVIPALTHALEEHTGLPAKTIQAARAELIGKGWIRIERNVVWVIEGLRHEPGYTRNNAKHQKGMLRYLDSLPRLQIVHDFRVHYAFLPGFPIPTSVISPSEGTLPLAAGDHPSPEPLQHTTDTSSGLLPQAKEPGAGPPARKKPEYPPWVTEGVAWWVETVGNMQPSRFNKILTSYVARFGAEKVRLALIAYVVEMQGANKTAKLEWFADEAAKRVAAVGKVRAEKVKSWQQEEYDLGIAKQPQVIDALKQYRRSLNGEGEQWWTRMKSEAQSRSRHPIAYAHEWLKENRV